MDGNGKIIDFSAQKALLVNNKYKNKLRSYDGIIEYSFLEDYEHLIEPATKIDLGDITLVLYEGRENLILLGIQFLIKKFTVNEVVNWLETHQVFIIPKDKDTGLVRNVNAIVEGMKFYGNVILICQKGFLDVSYDSKSYEEITKRYSLIEESTNLSASRVLNLEKPVSTSTITINGTHDLDNFQRINLDPKIDEVFVNGLFIQANYIDVFIDTIGFFQNLDDESKFPIAFITNPEHISIQIEESKNGCRTYTIDSINKKDE
ncbi:MAG: hypothetical protein WCS44_08240 [Bacillota bacterium]